MEQQSGQIDQLWRLKKKNVYAVQQKKMVDIHQIAFTKRQRIFSLYSAKELMCSLYIVHLSIANAFLWVRVSRVNLKPTIYPVNI